MKIHQAILVLLHVASVSSLSSAPWGGSPPPIPGTTSIGQPGSWDLPSVGSPVRIEGKSRRTWNFDDVTRDTVQVALGSEGRPLNSEIEVWIGPDWTPLKLKQYSEDGLVRPAQTLVGTRKRAAQVEVRNTGPDEFPVNAACAYAVPPLSNICEDLTKSMTGRYIEGSAIYSVPIEPEKNKVQVYINTDTRQLHARVELLNGPNNIKQEYEIFTNNGLLNALYVVFNCPGGGNTVRIKNLAPFEFPCRAYITPL